MNIVEENILPQHLAPLNISEARKRRRQNKLNPIKNTERKSDVELKEFVSSDVTSSSREVGAVPPVPICTSPEPESIQVDDAVFLMDHHKGLLKSQNVAEDISSAISRDEEPSEEELEESEIVQIESKRETSSHQNKFSLRRLSHKKLSQSTEPLEPVEIKVKKHKKEKRKKTKHQDVGSNPVAEEARSNATTISAALNEIIDMVEVINETQPPQKPPRSISRYSDKGSEISLISDGKVYVQHGRSFTATTREKAFVTRPTSRREISPLRPTSTTALSMAVGYQKMFLPLSTTCHGLLAGIAIWQCITVFQQKGGEDIMSFVDNYSHVARIFQSLFYLLTTVACVAVLDRCVPGSFSWTLLWELLVLQPCCLLALVACCGALLCSGIAAKLDDRLALHSYNDTIWSDPMETNENLSEWLTLNLVRCALAVASYLIVSLSWGDNSSALPFPEVVSTVKPVPSISN